MNAAALGDSIVLGALSGMRSLAGPTALAFQHGGFAKNIASVLAAGEMAMDKTSIVGDRIDAIPLAGRAVMGALAGTVVARESDSNVFVAAAVGAAAAVAMAHLAFRLRRRFPGSSTVGGFVEDALVIGLGALYCRKSVSRDACPTTA